MTGFAGETCGSSGNWPLGKITRRGKSLPALDDSHTPTSRRLAPPYPRPRKDDSRFAASPRLPGKRLHHPAVDGKCRARGGRRIAREEDYGVSHMPTPDTGLEQVTILVVLR